jgi:hypothetical protein
VISDSVEDIPEHEDDEAVPIKSRLNYSINN